MNSPEPLEPKPGEIREFNGKRHRFIENDDRGQVWEILDEPAKVEPKTLEVLDLKADRFDALGDGRHDRMQFMAEAGGWVMACKPGHIPFVIARSRWERAPLYEVGKAASEEYRALFFREALEPSK